MTVKIIERSKLWFALSGIIILIGIISLLTLGLNFGIDFTGGNRIVATFPQGTTVEDIRSVLSEITVDGTNLGNSFIQTLDGDDFSIRTIALNEEQRKLVLDKLNERFGVQSDKVEIDFVGPVVGRELIRNAVISLTLASVLLVVYISFRFEFKFAISAIVALLFDAFVVLTIFSITQIELNQPFVAAILTIVGYSINDTIVVFDRIRENLKYPGKDLAQKVNESISQTLRRSINTSVTTLLVLGSILFFAGDTLKPFAIPLFFGVISGTYSSIFLASPLWHAWKVFEGNKKHKKLA
ncbi:protein translocase subunit secF [Anaerobranca californiensis DSM 14826]|jgi:preprotein translocase subunit SecF|uniref:Protein-export membrane protein SecF n=1 Tax=Anaerobranca californiensis DSM 14826 TaxID=1120989 RepID=A0A1M6LMX6_9FIRM|nr:protein translocase subunit SecF [Anaerobranca californiensis]SHJ72576.1 protein translocase subunit secF [Anaerobranca californiensis DSM 14826]